MLDDAYQAGTSAALRDLAERPPLQPVDQRRFSVWGLASGAVRGLPAIPNEVLGTVADVVKAFGTASALTLDSDPIARATLTRESIEQGRRDAKAAIDRGDLMTSGAGDALRAGADYWAPDPITAHWSEIQAFDFVRMGGKVVGGALLAGPFGLAAAAGEEGVTQSDKLRRQGVDLETRTGVGALTSAAVGIGAALPVAGTTLARTGGLVAVGGPGTFVAQQAATRELLQRAGYDEIASTYDPFDPVGLAMSTLIPAGFGAYGLRANRARAAAEAKAADDAMLARPEPPSELTPAAQAARGYVDETMVDAARVAYAVEQRRIGSLADLDDIRGAAQDESAMSQAALQLARGDRVEVTNLAPESAPRVVLERMSEMTARLEEARAELVATAEGLAERGQVRQARIELAQMEQTRPDTSEAAIEAVARQIQERGDRMLLKTAMREAREVVAGRLDDWEARAQRLTALIERNAEAQRAVQALPEMDRRLAASRADDARRQPPAVEPDAEPAAAAAQALDKLMAGDLDAARRIVQEAMAKPGDQIVRTAPVKPAGAAPEGSASVEATRIAELESSNPQALDAQIVTGWDDKGAPLERMSARDYLAEVERMAGEEAADARLLDVAVQCALRAG